MAIPDIYVRRSILFFRSSIAFIGEGEKVQIFLLVLKIIGLVLLGLLALVIFLLLLLLFWPICYRALVSYHGEPYADVKVGWLGIISFKLKYEKGEQSSRLSVIGIPLKKKGGGEKAAGRETGRRKRREKRGAKKQRDEKKEDFKEQESPLLIEKQDKSGDENPVLIENQENEKQEEKRDMSSGKNQIPEKQGPLMKLKGIPGKLKSALISVFSKISAAFGKIKSALLNIKEKIKGIWNKFLRLCHKIKKVHEFINLKENHECVRALLKIGTRLLKHIKPRKIKGFVRFGMDDPCRTGQLLGVLAVFYGFYGKNISIYPEFEESCLDGEVLIKGNMQVGVILFHALRIYLSKELKTLKYNYQQLKEEL